MCCWPSCVQITGGQCTVRFDDGEEGTFDRGAVLRVSHTIMLLGLSPLESQEWRLRVIHNIASANHHDCVIACRPQESLCGQGAQAFARLPPGGSREQNLTQVEYSLWPGETQRSVGSG